MGLVQGPAWPCCGKLMKTWIPKSKFATVWSLLTTSSNVAGAVGPLFATWIAVNYHWTYGFLIPAYVSMTFAYIALLLLRNRPSDIGIANINKIKKQGENNVAILQLSLKKQLIEMLKAPFFMILCLTAFIITLVKTTLTDWSQLYLIKAVRLDNFSGKIRII